MKGRSVALAGAVALALALFGSHVAAWRRVAATGELVALSQGAALLAAFQVASPPFRGPPDPEALRRFVTANAAFGVQYLALVHDEGGVELEAGSAPHGPRVPGPGELATDGPLRFVAGPPPPFDPGAPRVVIGFVPLLSDELRLTATRNLLLSGLAAGVVVVTAGLLARAAAREEAAAAAAEHARRLASLGEMSAILAHEIRNPLASLKGHAQLLEEEVPEDQRPRVSRVVREATRLEALTGDLLGFARTGKVERRPVDPGALAAEVAAEVDGVRLERAGAPASWPLDAVKVRLVIGNLLRNAREVSPEVELRVAEQDGDLVLTVRDFGPGFPEGDAARLFEPFYTTRTQGTGLGLAVVKRVVEGHGGTAQATNHPEGGATFTVRLPGQEGAWRGS